MKKSTFYFTILLIGGIVFGLYYFGIVQEIKINEQEVGPFKVVYETHIGDYSEVGVIQEKIYSSLVSDGINTTKSFGIYYDNPDNTDKDKLRSEIGVIIESGDYSKITGLKGKYNVKDISKTKNVVIDFPYRNKFSIII
jgi:DNA gyrase inhibitor GyrI